MKRLAEIAIALSLLAFVAACFSGSSSTGTRPAPKRLGESGGSAATTQSSSGSGATSGAAAEGSAAPADATAAGEKTLRTLYVNVNSANVRAMPSREATIVAKLKFLDPVGATGALDGEWVQVEVTMPDGAIGKAWIHSTLVSASREQAEAVKAAAGGK